MPTDDVRGGIEDARQPRAAPPPDPFWQDARSRGIIFQMLAIGTVLLVGWYLVSNTLHNLETRNIRTGYDYLANESGFNIAETLITYDATSTYGRALFVGILNTLQVSALSIVFATFIGTFFGLARLSPNFLVRKLAASYVDTLRNLPLLLQLFFWYAVILKLAPVVRQALQPLPGVYLSNRGLVMPVPEAHAAHSWMFLAFAIGIGAAIWLNARANLIQAATGERPASLLPGLGAILGLPFLIWLGFGAPADLDVPALSGFNIRGGMSMTPEFTALFVGLTTYHAAFIAEIVRGGVLAVQKGQWEAGTALGLNRIQLMRLVVLPQALRVIVPPMTSMYLNITKNSSLAVAIGYPELVYVTDTTINQAGRAIEAISIMMAVYLSISLSISLFMNWYNARVALTER